MKKNIPEIFKYFFRLGVVAFGGPAAHVAMMEADLVEDKKWLSEEEFLDYMGATNLIPGPNSTEMTMHCGYHRGGPLGLFVAGISFIVPAVMLTLLVAVFFESISEIDWVIPIIDGIKAAVLSFIVAAILKLGKKAVKNNYLAVLGLLVIVAAFFGINEIICILTAGFIYMALNYTFKPSQNLNSFIFLPLLFFTKTGISYLKLFFVFLKVGAVLFGSGYVLFAYLDGEFINSEWGLTHTELVEAIAVGQITPGPVLSTATFIGYKLGGFQGALLATVGMFLPSFLYVWLLNPLIPKMKKNKLLSFFLQAVNVAAVAVMVVVTLIMAKSILMPEEVLNWKLVAISALSFVVYFSGKKVNALWIVVLGAMMGFLLSLI